MAYQFLLLVAVYLLYHVSNNDLYFWKSALMRLHQSAYSNPKCSVEVIADISKHIMSCMSSVSVISFLQPRSLFSQQSLVSMRLDHMIFYNRISKSQKQRHLAGHLGYLCACDGKHTVYFCEHSEFHFLDII